MKYQAAYTFSSIIVGIFTSYGVLAQSYPSKPVRLVVPFSAGSTTDISARIISNQLAPLLGQPVYIENRAGADGSIGMMAAKNLPADGYTLVSAGWTNLTVNPVVMKDLPYDPVKDFKPISGFTRGMIGLAVSGNSKYKTVSDLVAAAKSSSKQLDFGTFSAGYRLAMEWFATASGVRFAHVPYKTPGQMNGDLMGNQIDVALDALPSLTPMLKAGKLRLIAVMGDRRHAEFGDVPMMKESGYPEISIYGWSAVYVRSETPDDISEKLADVMRQVL
ncbi:MAG: Bug family tripartite tricarboxylate transporter substrate binding protein, partial [Burkholderiales bacterium]